MSEPSDRGRIEQSVQRCYSTWSDSYYRDYYQFPTAYPPIHTAIVREELIKLGPGSLIDAGCGPASMLQNLGGLDLERFGFDLTNEMVQEARRVMAAQGVANDHIWQGSVLDRAAFRIPPRGYGAAICFGVLPHIPSGEDPTVLANLVAAVRPGGLVVAEARNQLFALFTLNRYSRDFFRKILINEAVIRHSIVAGEQQGLDTALAELDERFRLDVRAVRKGKAGEPGYDEVLSRTHNPFEMQQIARAVGLTDVEVLFYHYHCLPPMLERHLPTTFREYSIAMEDSQDWRGHFLASAFILKGRKPVQ